MSLRNTIILILLSLPILAIGQFDHAITFDEKDGLPNSVVRAIHQDKNGFMWIGTTKGVSRFDGVFFENYVYNANDEESLQLRGVTSLIADSNRIWMGGARGFAYIDLNDYSITNKLFDESGFIDSLSTDDYLFKPYTHSFLLRDGILWMGTRSFGLVSYHIAEDSLSFLKVSDFAHTAPKMLINTCLDNVISLAFDKEDENIIWLGTLCGLGKYNISTGDIKVFRFEDEVYDKMTAKNAFRRLYQDKDGTIYYSTWGHGVNRFHPSTGYFEKLPLNNPDDWNLFRVATTEIWAKNEKELWIESGHGLMTYDKDEKRITTYLRNNNDIKEYYGIDFMDDQGRIWAESNYGLHLYDPMLQQAEYYSFEDLNLKGQAGFIRGVVESKDGSMLTVSPQGSDGIFHLDLVNKSWKKTSVPSFTLNENGHFNGASIARNDKYGYAVASRTGVFLYDPKTSKNSALPIEIPLRRNFITSVLWDTEDRLWITTSLDGIFIWNPIDNSLVQHLDDLNKQEGRNITAYGKMFMDSEENIWFEVKGGHGVYLSDKKSFNFYFVKSDPEKTLISVQGFTEDQKGRVWFIATNGNYGYALVNSPEDGLQIKKSIFSREFQESYTTGIVANSKGELWVKVSNYLVQITDSGDVRPFSLDYTQAFDKGTWHYDILSDDQIFLGSSNGVILIDTDRLKRNATKPVPYITEVRILGEPVKGNFLQGVAPLKLNYNERNISFSFSSIGYTLANQNQYKYKLEGFDEDWIEAGKRRFVNYTNLQSGDYTFKLLAANNEGLWSETEGLVKFSLATPWWASWWFRLSAVLSVLAVVYLYYSFRITQIRKEEKIKSEFGKKLTNMELSALRAQMNPHFIFNSLNSIESYIVKNEPFKAAEYINDFARLMRLILQNSRSDYVNLKDEIEALELYLQMESMRFSNKFNYHIRLGHGVDASDIDIPPMLIQPFVENAIWHGIMPKAEGGSVDISIEKDNGVLRCIIEDDGIGRKKSAEINKRKNTGGKKSMGMSITKDRIDAINEIYNSNTSVKINDLTDESGAPVGTRVELKIPV